MEYALQVKNLNKAFENFALKNVNIDVPQGSIVGFIGENGAGKSTTFKAMMGLIEKDSGEVLYEGKPFDENSVDMKEKIGVVMDEMGFYESLTSENIGNVYKAAYKSWEPDVFNNYLSSFNIDSKQQMSKLSKGNKMKLKLAAALSHKPELLILDEPTSGLDPVMRDDLLDIFLDFVQKENHSILLSSHITSDLERIADYIVFIHEGKIVFAKEKDDLIYNYGIIKCTRENFEKIDMGKVIAWRDLGHEYDLLVSDKAETQKAYPQLVVDTPSIDEIMLMYVKGTQEGKR